MNVDHKIVVIGEDALGMLCSSINNKKKTATKKQRKIVQAMNEIAIGTNGIATCTRSLVSICEARRDIIKP